MLVCFRCISPDSIGYSDDEEKQRTPLFSNGSANLSNHSCSSISGYQSHTNGLNREYKFTSEKLQSESCNPIFKRLPNFEYEGRCKDEFERLHEILSYSPWRKRAEESKKKLISTTKICKQKPTNAVPQSSVKDNQLLSPSEWAFADDVSDSDCNSPILNFKG